MSDEDFGTYLKRLRKAKGVTVRSLDRRTGISHSYLSNIENGNRNVPSPGMIRKLSSALGVTHIGMMIKAGHITLDEVLTVRREHGIIDEKARGRHAQNDTTDRA